MSSLLVLNGVYSMKIKSLMLVFSTQLCELLPLPYSAGVLTYHILFLTRFRTYKIALPPQSKMLGGLRQINILPQSLFTGQFF
jgi:hypothetical protein